MTLKIFNIGASHRSAAISFREGLAIPEDQIGLRLREVKENFELKEAVVLSTCNRVEFFIVCEHMDHEKSSEILESFVKKEHITRDAIKQNSHFYEQSSAVHHMMEVTASLDSIVLGETQITGQIKDAVNIAREQGCIGPILERLHQESLTVTKQIRRETAIGQKTVSVSHAALDLAKTVFTNISSTSILIIGAGEMARTAAQYSQSYRPKNLTILNRTIDKAQAVTQTLGMGSFGGLDDLDHQLHSADIMISATSATEYILSSNHLKRILSKRKGKPLFIVDIAIPRDIDPEIRLLEDVYLFDIDDLKEVVDDNMEERRKAAKDARFMISKYCHDFTEWLDRLSIKPVLADFHNYIFASLQKELEKTLAREIFSSLNSQQKEALDRMVDAAARKLSAQASKTIQRQEDPNIRSHYAYSLKKLFLDKEST